MVNLITALRGMITYDIYASGAEDIPTPHITYEYDSIPLNNQQQIFFAFEITSDTEVEAEQIATNLRKQLHNQSHFEAEVGFKVTDTPTIQSVPDQLQGKYCRRLTFEIIAYFKED